MSNNTQPEVTPNDVTLAIRTASTEIKAYLNAKVVKPKDNNDRNNQI